MTAPDDVRARFEAKVRLTAVTRRGLRLLLNLAEADLEASDRGKFSASQRREAWQAVAWLRQNSLPQPKRDEGDGR